MYPSVLLSRIEQDGRRSTNQDKESVMGYYIQTGELLGKATFIVNHYGAELVDAPKILPVDKAIICVISNGLFEGAGLCYSQAELEEFRDDKTGRPKVFLLMDKALAIRLQ